MYCRVVRASRHALSIRAPGRCRDGRQPRARADRAARARRGRAVRRVHHARRRRVSPVRGQQRGRRGVGSRAPSPAVAPRRAPPELGRVVRGGDARGRVVGPRGHVRARRNLRDARPDSGQGRDVEVLARVGRGRAEPRSRVVGDLWLVPLLPVRLRARRFHDKPPRARGGRRGDVRGGRAGGARGRAGRAAGARADVQGAD